MKNIDVSLYADFGAPYGKGLRLKALQELLKNCGDLNVNIYARNNYGNLDGASIPSLPTRLYIYKKVLFNKLGVSKGNDRNDQEELFDSWLTKRVRSNNLFLAPGFYRTINQHKDSNVIIHAVAQHPKHVIKCLGKIKCSSIDLGYRFDDGFLLRESNRIFKSLKGKPKVIAPSEVVSRTYNKYYDSNLVYTQSIPQHKSLVDARANRECKCFGFVGTLSLIKGVHMLIEAFANEFRSYDLKLWGPVDPSIRDELFRRISKLRNVEYCGYGEVQNISSQIDCLVVPSFLDAEPRVIREFCDLNIPVIAPNDITAMDSSVINKYTSFECYEKDYTEMLASIKKFLDRDFVPHESEISLKKEQSSKNTDFAMTKELVKILNSIII